MAHQFGRVQVTPPGHDQSLGELVASATKDLSTLIRMEKDLAKTELKDSAKRALPLVAGGMVATVVLLPAALMFSTWAALGIGHWVGNLWGFFVMWWFWMIIAGFGGLMALRAMRRMSAPERTIQTIKDTADWARHPTMAPDVKIDTLAES